jgi:RND family efflux transporter MFP subunit
MKSRLVFSSLLLALLAGCSKPNGPVAAAALPTATVRTAEVRAVTSVRRQDVPGTVRTVERASLAPKVMGVVETMSVKLGQSVKRGDVLVKISANEIGARLAQARAGLNQAQRDLDRETALLAKGASTADLVRNLEDRQRLMQATVEEAQTMLAYTAIAAPFDGVVTRKLVNEGDLAAPGHPLLEIENPAKLRLEVEVPEALAGIPVGTAVPVQVGAAELTGTIAELAPSSDAMSRTFLAKIDLPAGTAVRSGQFARVAWPAGEGAALLVPAAAVSLFGQMERVFVVSRGRADLRLVKTGARHGDLVEVLSGLSAGEKVVTEGAATLREGQPVAEVRS